jgi:hypothetical protein
MKKRAQTCLRFSIFPLLLVQNLQAFVSQDFLNSALGLVESPNLDDEVTRATSVFFGTRVLQEASLGDF